MVNVLVASPEDTLRGVTKSPVRIPGSLSLVLPAHNEEANIKLVVERALDVLPLFADDFEVVIVNDGSRDKTATIIDELAANDKRVRPIHHKKNKGYGGALTTGFESSNGEFVMFMDADRQFDIADIGICHPWSISSISSPGFAWSEMTNFTASSLQRYSISPCASFLACICAISTAPSKSSGATCCAHSSSQRPVH